MRKALKMALLVIVGFLLLQLVPIDRTVPLVKKSENFVDVLNTPREERELLKTSCYDCHSFETQYPKAAYIAPISWSIQHNISTAREHVNFSIWSTYNEDLRTSMLKNTIEVLSEGTMPIPGYTAQHPKAKLNSIERKFLADYFKEVLEKGNY